VVSWVTEDTNVNLAALTYKSLWFFRFSHEFTDSPSDSPEVVIVMNSFKTKIIKVKVSARSSCCKELSGLSCCHVCYMYLLSHASVTVC